MKTKNILIILLSAIVSQSMVFAQTPQEMQRETYLPRNPIAIHVIKSLSNAFTISYTGAGTSPVVAYATPTLTIGSSLATYSFNTDGSDPSVDTLQELVASISSKSGWSATLGDQFTGGESVVTSVIVDKATASCILPVSFDVTSCLNFGTKLYQSAKTPIVYRILWTNTYSSGNSYLRIYRGVSAQSNTDDTLIAQITSGATTVEKEFDLTPYFIQGLQNGYLKIFVENSAAQTAGTLTILGAYR